MHRAVAAALLAAIALPAAADVKAVGRYKDWRVFTEGSGTSLVCFAAVEPSDEAPRNIEHGDVNFYVATWKAHPTSQTSIKVGYTLRKDVYPEAIVGRDHFKRYASGDEAFAEDGVEKSLLAAIKKGTELRIEAASVKDARTAYTFSLKGSTEAIDKAKAASMFRRPTKTFEDRANSGGPSVLSLHGVVASEGGLPLMRDGKVIGGIGCSGGTGQQDGVACKAGADTIK